MGGAYAGGAGALSFNVCVQLRLRLVGGAREGILGGGRGRPEGRVASSGWSAFDKFDYRTVKVGGGTGGSGFTSDSRKELIGRSPVMAYELGTKPRAYRGSAVNGEGAAGCSIRVPCHTHSSSPIVAFRLKWLLL